MSELQALRDDLNKTIDALSQTARRLKVSARNAAEKRSDYEQLKNNYLVQMAAEDSLNRTKRTVALQQAIYRKMYENERRAYLLAEADFDSDKDLFRGLQAKLNAQMAIARITETEMKLGENFQ